MNAFRTFCLQPSVEVKVLLGSGQCGDITRIETAKVGGVWYRRTMFDALQVQLDDLVNGSAMEKSQDFGEGERGCDGADEWRTNAFPRKKRNSTSVEVAVVQHLLIARAITNIFAAVRSNP